ncbi:MAG: GH13_10 / GH13 / GH13_9 / GH13_36 / GH13_ 11 / GH13_37 / GH13_1 / GH13_8, partial [uncultured Rubrobacteraceae bacterium]
MRHRHEMPFGANLLGDGRARFALWAPDAGSVDLVLRGETVPMSRGEDGLFEAEAGAAHGDLYRYRIDGEGEVPDPASRYQPEDVHGPSMVVDPERFEWDDEGWTGRPWEETVLYELHVGTFSPEGTFAGAEARLDYLAELGVTAVQIMPLSDFPGGRNWGYDGVLPYAPDSSYGTPEELKSLVAAAHARGLQVFLDVVYNHFGPDGNYLHVYAKSFFTERHETPWGAGINYDGDGSPFVRGFFAHNALYWLEEYRFDGLRFDAVHAIKDDSDTHFLEELSGRVRTGPGRDRHVHLVLENEGNNASYLRPGDGGSPLYDAQWDDDYHNSLHVVLTGEDVSYYADYADAPVQRFGRCLAEGFTYQGETSPNKGEVRGEPSGDLAPTAFVSFLQNHDQVGNRAFGDRIPALARPEAVAAAAAVYLVSPQVPMLFMGEEWDASTPFLFFCDFGEDLAPLVTEGRRAEFAKFPAFSDPETRDSIPDPGAEETFRSSALKWDERDGPGHAERL